MDHIRVIIVDDEELGRESVRSQLHDQSDFSIVAECGSGKEAIKQIEALRPDVVFLDVQMPRTDGFEVLKRVGDQMPITVLVTAYDQYALRAFDTHALDYVLKPLDPERFARTLDRVRQRVTDDHEGGNGNGLRQLVQELSAHEPNSKRIVLKATGRLLYLEPDELKYVESAGNYLKVHVDRDVFLLRETMVGLAERLNPARFIRIHRSFVVNTHHVREVRLLPGGSDYEVALRDGTQLPVGRSYRSVVADGFGRE